MQRSPRFLAESGGAVVGMASLGRYQGAEGESENSGELYGLWVTPALRGTGVATALGNAASRQASDDGRSHVVYWVSTSNGRAVAFASGLGFRPTDDRRPESFPNVVPNVKPMQGVEMAENLLSDARVRSAADKG